MDVCDRIHELWDRQTAGAALDADDAALIRAHLERCPGCRLEAEAVAAMDFDGPDGPPPWADDLSRRRMIDAVVDGAEKRAAEGSARRRRALAAAGLGAAAAAAAVVVWVATGAGTPLPDDRRGPGVAETLPAPVDGRVLLIAGDAEASRASLDRAFAAGDALPEAAGPVVLGLGPGIRVALEPGVAGRVSRLDREAVTIEMEKGSLVAWVDPDRDGPVFSIATKAGTVEVEGTVFGLEVAGASAEVGVLRGRVILHEPGREVRRIGIGESAVLGSGIRAPLEPEAEARAQAALSLMDLLDPDGGEARVEIRSLPAGALVSLDDVPLGATPLAAAVRPGHRAIALDLAGHAPVREILELPRGGLASRVFDLQAGEAVPAPAGGAGEATGAVARPETAADLLARAQTLRAARDWAAAAATYDAILRRHGSSTEARAAAISSATIKLDHLGDARGALRLFEGYLARHGSGTLAQEAAWGRCRALRVLGRGAEERVALREFLAGHPAALESGQARARLAGIEK